MTQIYVFPLGGKMVTNQKKNTFRTFNYFRFLLRGSCLNIIGVLLLFIQFTLSGIIDSDLYLLLLLLLLLSPTPKREGKVFSPTFRQFIFFSVSRLGTVLSRNQVESSLSPNFNSICSKAAPYCLREKVHFQTDRTSPEVRPENKKKCWRN